MSKHPASIRNATAPISVVVIRIILYFLQPFIFFFSLFSHIRERAPITRFPERLGKTSSKPSKRSIIWLHASSLGEVKRLKEILFRLSAYEGVEILVTTFTKSSADWLAKEFPAVIHQFSVMDTRHCVQRFLDYWDPEVLIISENEIWPEMIIQSKKRGVIMLQVGIRPSRTRRRFPEITSFLLNHCSIITCLNEDVRANLLQAGVQSPRVLVCADGRKSSKTSPLDDATRRDLGSQSHGRRLWLAASTHEADHEVVLTAQSVLSRQENMLLVVAPRHPRSAAAIKSRCKRHGLVVAQRSTFEEVTKSTDVYLADTLGELEALFSLSPVVFLGGALGGEGGHNPYEPAAFGCEIITGPDVENFRQAYASVGLRTKVTFVETARQLVQAVKSLWFEKDAWATSQTSDSSAEPRMIEAVDVVMAEIMEKRPSLLENKNETASKALE